MSSVLVVAAEASGDRIAAGIARALVARGAQPFGVGGPGCARAGVELVGTTTTNAAMGVADVAFAAPRWIALLARLLEAIRVRKPSAAVLVNASELSATLGRWLRRRGVRVLWCVAPQVWAWRGGRLQSLRGAFDRLAVVLPFEEALWRDAGHAATYVGHPVLDVPPASREDARAALDLPAAARALAVLPGSRRGEIARLADVLLDGALRLRARGGVDAVVAIEAPGLSTESRALLASACAARRVSVVRADDERGASPLLAAFDVALAASGTASLEAALAGAAPVVAARLDPLAYAIARRLVTTPHVALANILLGRHAFPELVQDAVSPGALADGAEKLLANRARTASDAAELRRLLDPGLTGTFGERVVACMSGW